MKTEPKLKEKEEYYQWLDTPSKERDPSNVKDIAAKLGVSIVTLYDWKHAREEPDSDVALSDKALKELALSGKNPMYMKMWRERLGLDKKEDGNSDTITADEIARAFYGVREELQREGYPTLSPVSGVGEMQT